ncbi:Uma2 family endonuclease [Actinoplanes sp. NPDC000266]
MTAQPAGELEWAPDPIRQRNRAYTIEDVLKMRVGAPRVELLAGALSVVPTPSGAHQKISGLLWMWMLRHAPTTFEPLLAVGILVGVRETLEPDVLLLHKPVDLEHHFFDADQVSVAVEIVSPSTKRRDRLEKPAQYAKVGVPHYWRIEQDPVHVYAYDLVGGCYQLAADAEDELVLSAPFEIKLPIRDITP